MRCLIVDDSPGFLAAARGLLERQGLTVAVASTGEEAVRRLPELQPDVVLVDIDLGGESGLDLAERLAELSDPVSIILISTHAEDDYHDLIAASSAAGFVPKARLSARAIQELLGPGPSGPRGT